MAVVERFKQEVMYGLSAGTKKSARCREVAVVERWPLVEVRLYIYMFTSLKVSALLPCNSEKQSMNDIRLSGVDWSKICIYRKKYACMIKFQLQCLSIFTGYRTISPKSFPFLLEIFFVKDCIEEITCFVAAVK